MKKKDKKILDTIQKKANAMFGDKLWKMQPKADVMLEVIDKALTEKRDLFSEEDLDKLKSIRDSHILDGEEKVMDMDVAKEMDDFMKTEITKAIESGELVHPDKDPYYKKIKQLHARTNKQD